MKVLEKSRTNRTYKQRCECGALLLVGPEDIKTQQGRDQWDQPSDWEYKTYECPECGCDQEFKPEDQD